MNGKTTTTTDEDGKVSTSEECVNGDAVAAKGAAEHGGIASSTARRKK